MLGADHLVGGTTPLLLLNAEILTPTAPFEPEQDEIDELESIPVLATEPEETEEKDRRNVCHLSYKQYGQSTLCGAPSAWHISAKEYQPGTNCHSCKKRRCQKCVAVLQGHNG